MDNLTVITAAYNEMGITKTGKVFQWSKGQTLVLSGFESLPASFEMQYQNADGTPIDAVTVIGTDGQVSVPDTLLANGSNIEAWMYLPESNDSGTTVYRFIIPIIRRPRPADYTYSQEQMELVDQAIAALNDAVSRTEASAQAAANSEEAAALSEQNAKASEEAAAESERISSAAETNASNSAVEAKASEDAAAQSATLASSYANFITDTVSGAVAFFPDGAGELPVISCDSPEDGTVEVEYRADAALYINKKIAALIR